MNKVVDHMIGTALEPIIRTSTKGINSLVESFGEITFTNIENKIRKTFCFKIVDPRLDKWKSDCFYKVIGRYNDLTKGNNLEIINKEKKSDANTSDWTENYEFILSLNTGVHFLKYRNYKIIVCISDLDAVNPRNGKGKLYEIASYNINDNFIETFKNEMMAARNLIVKTRKKDRDLKIFQDNYYSEKQFDCEWVKIQNISRRPFSTIYLDHDLKGKIISTVDNFLANKDYYVEHGIPYKLNILLYGKSGTGKDSIARAIASEYGKDIFYVEGGKSSNFIPESLSINAMSFVSEKVFIVSDFDRYPQYINEPELSDEDIKAGKDNQSFAKMLNVLDGMNAIENRILIITTNHIEKFSETFTRPGRIDLLLEIPYVSKNVFKEFTEKMYGREITEDFKLKSDSLTIGTLQQDILFYKMEFLEYMSKYTK